MSESAAFQAPIAVVVSRRWLGQAVTTDDVGQYWIDPPPRFTARDRLFHPQATRRRIRQYADCLRAFPADVVDEISKRAHDGQLSEGRVSTARPLSASLLHAIDRARDEAAAKRPASLGPAVVVVDWRSTSGPDPGQGRCFAIGGTQVLNLNLDLLDETLTPMSAEQRAAVRDSYLAVPEGLRGAIELRFPKDLPPDFISVVKQTSGPDHSVIRNTEIPAKAVKGLTVGETMQSAYVEFGDFYSEAIDRISVPEDWKLDMAQWPQWANFATHVENLDTPLRLPGGKTVTSHAQIKKRFFSDELVKRELVDLGPGDVVVPARTIQRPAARSVPAAPPIGVALR